MNAEKTKISGTWSKANRSRSCSSERVKPARGNPQRICRNTRATRASFRWFWMFPLRRSRFAGGGKTHLC